MIVDGGQVGQRFIADSIPERYVEVDAARLLLIVVRFRGGIDDRARALRCFPHHAVVGHFTPEYYLQKLDFLLRYPGYFVYELTELHRLGIAGATDRDEIVSTVRSVLTDNEPELRTIPFRRFWRGAYERIDEVEAWWYARALIYTGLEPRGEARPQKHYFVTERGVSEADRLVAVVPHALWYDRRVRLIHRFFGGLSASDVKDLQYSHLPYRQAQLNEVIPDLPVDEIRDAFARVFGEPLGIDLR